MIIAEISVVPVGTGNASISKFVARVFQEIKSLGLNPKLNGMSTEFEAKSIEEVCKAFERAHKVVFEVGAERAITSLKVDERKDKEASIEQKISSVKKKLE